MYLLVYPFVMTWANALAWALWRSETIQRTKKSAAGWDGLADEVEIAGDFLDLFDSHRRSFTVSHDDVPHKSQTFGALLFWNTKCLMEEVKQHAKKLQDYTWADGFVVCHWESNFANNLRETVHELLGVLI